MIKLVNFRITNIGSKETNKTVTQRKVETSPTNLAGSWSSRTGWTSPGSSPPRRRPTSQRLWKGSQTQTSWIWPGLPVRKGGVWQWNWTSQTNFESNPTMGKENKFSEWRDSGKNKNLQLGGETNNDQDGFNKSLKVDMDANTLIRHLVYVNSICILTLTCQRRS